MILRRARKAVAGVLKRTAFGRKVAKSVSLGRFAPAVVRSGLFDREFYQAQRGRRFRGTLAAAADYVVLGRPRGLAPNPLFEPEWLEPGRWRHGTEPTLRWAARPGRSTGPLFDPEVYLAGHPEAADHPGGPLGHFLARARPDDELPVPPGYPGRTPTWEQARTVLLDLARAESRRAQLRRSRRRASWDGSADARFVKTWLAAPLPSADPLVTVVMPVRNRPEQVLTAIASVRAQTLAGWELIVVDDGSTDRTPEVIAEVARTDPRIRLVRAEHAGVCVTRNRGLEQARGEYIAFLDSDNAWVPHFLQVMVAYLDSCTVRAGHSVVDSRAHAPEPYLATDGTLDHLLVKNHVDLNSLVVHRSVLDEVGGFDPALRRWVDHDLAIRIAKVTDLRLVPFVGIHYDGSDASTDRITLTEHDHWEYVVLGKHHVDWAEARAGLAQRVPGRVSICMPTYQDWALTSRAVRAVLDAVGDRDVEVVVLENGSRRSVASILAASFLGEPRVRLIRLPRNLHFAIGSNAAFAASTGATVVFLNNDTEVSAGWLEEMLPLLDDPDVRGVQPLLLYPDGTVQSAGTVFLPHAELPVPFLAEHPPQDALRVPAPIRLRVVTAAALAMRASDVVALKGFDPIFVNGLEDVDLCLRAVRDLGGSFAVQTSAVVMHHESKSVRRGERIQANRALFIGRWHGAIGGSDLGTYRQAGFDVVHVDPGVPPRDTEEYRVPRPVLARFRGPAQTGEVAGLPSLRWAIKIAAHAGTRGDGWGDTHFAAALAAALEGLGQQVVIDRRTSHQRPSSYLDDVVLTLRGLDDVAVQPGRVNLLWVISHPDLVGPEEIRRYDAAFAAGSAWAERMSQRTGRFVEPLLQACDPAAFHVDRRVEEQRHGVLFVGGSRKVFRPIVREALEAGVELEVYGGGWEPFGLGDHLKGAYLSNDRLGAAYAGAEVVLCDHWDDMAREGFLSNRLFDAVACGARVVSDAVDGLDLFGGSVQAYRTAEDLRRLCGPQGRRDFPDDEDRRAVAKRIVSEHSFEARARRLLAVALELWERDGQPDDGRLDDGQPDDGQPDDGRLDDGRLDDGQPGTSPRRNSRQVS